MWTIFVDRLNLAPEAVAGVALIGIYFVYILGMSYMRIKRGDHMHH